MATILPGTYVRIAGAQGSEGPFRGAGNGSSYGPGSSPNPGLWNSKYGSVKHILMTKDKELVQTTEKAYVTTRQQKILVPFLLRTTDGNIVGTGNGYVVAALQK